VAVYVKTASDYIPQGWISDNNYSSKNSFYVENGKQMARVIIRRYVEDEE
jgi:hypothetical protein